MTVIGTNIASIRAKNAAVSADAAQQKAMRRLSSGKRLGTAADDAAGVVITTTMTSRINGLSMSIHNISDGVSLLQTADGALAEVTNVLQRMREISVQAASGTYSQASRAALQSEIEQSVSQINSILSRTTFNGKPLFSDTGQAVQLVPGSPDYAAEEASRLGSGKTFVNGTLFSPGAAQFGIQSGSGSGEAIGASLPTLYSASDDFAFLGQDKQMPGGNTRFVTIANIDLTATASSDVLQITGSGGIDPSNYVTFSPTGSRSYNFTGTFTDAQTYGNQYAPLVLNASDGIAVIDSALQQVGTARSDIGAANRRLESQLNVAQATMINLTNARSQIEDADYSQETVNIAKTQILVQASTGMLSHANMSAQDVLKLLK